ncbi:MAG: hypothetical protein P1P88_17155 [Bacteroidales bacterium]|nr:hypothetical protein [Bacteroidales bacterium]
MSIIPMLSDLRKRKSALLRYNPPDHRYGTDTELEIVAIHLLDGNKKIELLTIS